MEKFIDIQCEMSFTLEGRIDKQVVVSCDDYRVSARNGVFVLISKSTDDEVAMLPIGRTTVSFIKINEVG